MSSTLPARLVAATLASALALVLTACSAPAAPSGGSASAVAAVTPTPTPEPPKPVDLSGEWTQINGTSETSFQSAVITGDTIEVQWNAPDLAAIYWAGTVVVPADGSTTFTWDSVNDTTKTENALMASSDPTKTFTYDDGEISYEVTALGTTVTVVLAKK